MAHISSDKLVYKPNDVAFFEVYVADALTKQPISGKLDKSFAYLYASLEILDSFETSVYQARSVKAQDGTIVFTYKVPGNAKGGEYQAKVTSGNFPDTIRKFRIKQYSAPELFVTVDFDKNNYSPSDVVKAKVKVRRPDGGKLPVGTSVQAGSLIGGKQVTFAKKVVLDAKGESTFEFTVPADFDQDSLSISVRTYLGYS